jgi:hypothetical protein
MTGLSFERNVSMNRMTTQFKLSLEKKVVSIYAKVAFGASGAPTLSPVNSKGIVSVTRNGAGDYTFVFGTKAGMLDTYVKLLAVRHIYDTSGPGAAPAAPGLYVKSNQVNVAGTCSLRLQLNAAGTATDPANGEIGYFEFVLGDSTAP